MSEISSVGSVSTAPEVKVANIKKKQDEAVTSKLIQGAVNTVENVRNSAQTTGHKLNVVS